MNTRKLQLQEYFNDNLKCWNDRVPVHVKSDFYDLNSFINGKSSLTQIEHEYLGNVSGHRLLHLQCHFGMDTISLSRMGAKCIGIDFSEKAIEEARKLVSITDTDVEFYQSNVYDILELNLGKFDRVFTSYGTIGWLPDLNEWARIISECLVSNGEFYICDFHPALYMFDFNTKQLAYSYFNIGAPYSEEETGSYADSSYQKIMTTHFWSHSLSEIVSSLLENNMQLTLFKEFDYSPYSCFPDSFKTGDDQYKFVDTKIQIPHLYLIKAVKI